jgi:hypothetical protein
MNLILIHQEKNPNPKHHLKPWKMHFSPMIRIFLSLMKSGTTGSAMTFIALMDLKTLDLEDKMETTTFSRWKKSLKREKISNGSISGLKKKMQWKDQNQSGSKNGSRSKHYLKTDKASKRLPLNKIWMEFHK